MASEIKNKCIKCCIEKNINEFHKKSDMKLGIRNICKECTKILDHQYYLENIEDERFKGKIIIKYTMIKNKLNTKFFCDIM